MRSSANSPAEPRGKRPGPGLALALGLLLGASAAQADMPAAVLEECAEAEDGFEQCLDAAQAAAKAELERSLAAAIAAQAAYAAITGDSDAPRSLEQAQQAFVLYRDLDCEVTALTAPADQAARHHSACLIDHDRHRATRLATLAPPVEPASAGIPEALADTTWRATTINGEPPPTDTPSTLTIAPDGSISGNAACNRYFAQAEITEDTLTITNLGTTRMACPEPQMDQEREFLEALEQAAEWHVESETLELLDETDALVAAFEAGD